mmetsp:Transcript_69004/g.114689  ORF Transcript_69004/g.114689 Transcript_69004/m.114689 type:complete len:213 (-) Transcript_69004:11-649(-)
MIGCGLQSARRQQEFLEQRIHLFHVEKLVALCFTDGYVNICIQEDDRAGKEIWIENGNLMQIYPMHVQLRRRIRKPFHIDFVFSEHTIQSGIQYPRTRTEFLDTVVIRYNCGGRVEQSLQRLRVLTPPLHVAVFCLHMLIPHYSDDIPHFYVVVNLISRLRGAGVQEILTSVGFAFRLKHQQTHRSRHGASSTPISLSSCLFCTRRGTAYLK